MVNEGKHLLSYIESIEEIDLDKDHVYIDGKRFTEADAEALADYSERTYEERRRKFEEVRKKNLLPGGKSLSGSKKHSPSIRVVLPEEVKNDLQRKAKASGMSVSKLTRKVIEEYLQAS